MDGSEPGESVAAAVLSGAPVDLQARTVRYGARDLRTLYGSLLTETASTALPRQPRNLATGLRQDG
jgi:hypothetical protein